MEAARATHLKLDAATVDVAEQMPSFQVRLVP
jgi:hypothetical protein